MPYPPAMILGAATGAKIIPYKYNGVNRETT